MTTLVRSAASFGFAALLTLGGSLAAVDTAEAQSRTRSGTASVQGPNGGATTQRQATRSPGQASVNRNTTTNSGKTTGTSRNRSTVATEDGYATTGTRTGPAGGVQTYQGQTTATADGYSRSASAQGSNGRGYTAQGDVARTADGVAVNRGVTTNSSATANRTATYTRP